MTPDRKIIEFTPKPSECLAFNFTDYEQALIAYEKCGEELVGIKRRLFFQQLEGKWGVVVLIREAVSSELVQELLSFMNRYGIQKELDSNTIRDLNYGRASLETVDF